MDNITSISDRVKKYIDYKGISINCFSKIVGTSNSYFNKMIKNQGVIGSDKIKNILRSYPDLSPEWLLTGKGEMLRSVEAQGRASQVLQEPREANPLFCAACEEKERMIASKEKQIEALERLIVSKDEMLELYKDRIEELKCNPVREAIKKSS